MTLQQLNYLNEIAKYGSINKAAKHLFVSQSSISSALRELESEIGIAIFQRHNKGVSFTKEGKRFYERVCPILECEKQVLDLYSKKNGPPSYQLKVSTIHFPFVTEAFTKLIQDLKESFYDVHLSETDSNRIIHDVASGKSNLGILSLSNINEALLKKIFKNRDLIFTPLKTVSPHVLMRKYHPLSDKKNIHVEDLQAFPYVTLQGGENEFAGPITLNFDEEIPLVDFEPSERIIHVNESCSFYNIIGRTDAFSIGTGILPLWQTDSNIISIPLNNPTNEMQIGYIRSTIGEISEEMSCFLDILQECLLSE